MFRRVGYYPTEAASGTEALQRIQTESFDLVLLDLNMPGMSGTAVFKAARPHAPNTVFLILTGYATLESAIIALRHWAYDMYLMQHAGYVVPMQELGAHLQDVEMTVHAARDLLRAPLHRLRHKIEAAPRNPRFIHTLQGRGYTFEAR